MVEDIMGQSIDPLDESINLDIPFSLQMADAVKNKAQPNEPGQQITALKSLRQDLVRALVVKERALANGEVPAVVLPPDEATMVSAGIQDVIKSEAYSETEGRLFMLADNTHIVGLLQLDSGVEEANGHWVYKVLDVHPVEMQPYVGGGEGFTEIRVL